VSGTYCIDCEGYHPHYECADFQRRLIHERYADKPKPQHDWKREALAAREVFKHRNPSATESKAMYHAWDTYMRIREDKP
jgi:hypothetical protein